MEVSLEQLREFEILFQTTQGILNTYVAKHPNQQYNLFEVCLDSLFFVIDPIYNEKGEVEQLEIPFSVIRGDLITLEDRLYDFLVKSVDIEVVKDFLK